jgi:hypothetical protein
MELRIGPLWLHRLDQWDLGYSPLLAAHWRTADRSVRVLCLWRWGLQLGPRGAGLFLTRRTLMIGGWMWRFA